jgi:hypothetical protein
MNKKRFIWLVPVLVMAFAMSACPGPDDGGSSDSGIGDNLKFTDELVYSTDGTVYMGVDRPLTVMGGNGLIRGGKLNFSIDKPNSMVPIVTLLGDLDERLGYNVFSRAEYDPFDAHGRDLAFTGLAKKLDTKNATSITKEEIYYIYVDKKCNVTAKGLPSVEYMYHDDNTGEDIPVSVTVSNFTLNLKQGWNPVTKILTVSATRGTLFIGPGDSDKCKWVLE